MAVRASKPRTLIKRFIFIIRDTKWKSKGVKQMENEYIAAINKLNEIEDADILHSIAMHFEYKSIFIRTCNEIEDKLNSDLFRADE